MCRLKETCPSDIVDFTFLSGVKLQPLRTLVLLKIFTVEYLDFVRPNITPAFYVCCLQTRFLRQGRLHFLDVQYDLLPRLLRI